MIGQRNGETAVQLDAAQTIAITLQAGIWSKVLGMIAQAPWIEADPIMREIRYQIAVAVNVPLPDDAAAAVSADR